MRIIFYFLVALIFSAQPAKAAWHEASSEHFVIYADQKAQTVRLFAERLEKYHAAMAVMLKQEPESPSPSNRVTVFVVNNKSNVRKLVDMKNKYVAGVYRPLAGNIVAIVPKLQSQGHKLRLNPETILRHEYAHHFLFNISNRTYPLWFQEGFAEFYASGRVKRDGTVVLGAPANHRAYELVLSKSVPTKRLLDTAGYLKTKGKRYDEFYGRSWLLFHYLTFDKDRKGQLARYDRLLTSGSSELEAADQAFGDLDILEKDLNGYLKNRRISALGIAPERLKLAPVTVRKLNAGEAAIMPVIMESRTGVDDEEAKEVVVEARRIAASYPDDPAVLEALAEAEFDAGYIDQAIAAADNALALDPTRVRAQIQKVYAYAGRAEKSKEPKKAWREVRKQIVAANRLETNHPIPLREFYKAYRTAGQTPTKIAIQGLQRALQIAPFDQELRMMVSAQYMDDGMFREAADTLRPLAYNPHQSAATEAAQKLLAIAEAANAKRTNPPATNNSIAASRD